MSEIPPTPPVPAPTPTPTPPAQPPTPPGAPAQLPDDHPLVKAFNAQKTEFAEAKRRLTEIDDANKSDTQKQADKITTLESELATSKAAILRAEVAAAKGVPANLISGTTKDELEAAADQLLAFKGGAPTQQLPGNQKPTGPVSQVQEVTETREDRRKRLAELKR